ncbi:MAG: TraR/DksA family transcriptional regulator [Planctomycetota bacterium]|jgi:RNA polymerase-binding protein DksA
MNDTNHASGLTREELDELKQKLLEMRADIVGAVANLEDEALRSSDEEVSVDHMADHGSDSYEQEQSIILMERQNGTLREVNAAIRRLEDGTYGICEVTGKPIGKARLSAIPYARLCLDAQMEEEGGGRS